MMFGLAKTCRQNACTSEMKLSRRSMLACCSALATTQVGWISKAVAATRVNINIAAVPYNGNGDGATDNTGAFNLAFSKIASSGGGSITVPPGTYVITGAVTYTGSNPIAIIGSGKGVSIISIPTGGSGMNINPAGATPPPVTINGLSFSPDGGTTPVSCTALTIAYQTFGDGIYGNVSMTDVDFGVGMGSSFMTALALTQVGQSYFRGIQIHATNGNYATGSIGITLTHCIDVRIDGASITSVDTGIALLDSQCEGLHLNECVIICNTGLTTQNPGSNTDGVNLLGLYVTGCEFNCSKQAAILYLVATGWISDTHFGLQQTPTGTISVSVFGCSYVQFSNCSFTGQFVAASPMNYIGLYTTRASNGQATGSLQVHNCQGQNLGTGVYFDAGTYLSNVEGLQVADYSGNLVGNGTTYGAFTMRAVYDANSPSNNEAQWITSYTGSSNTKSTRFLYQLP